MRSLGAASLSVYAWDWAGNVAVRTSGFRHGGATAAAADVTATGISSVD